MSSPVARPLNLTLAAGPPFLRIVYTSLTTTVVILGADGLFVFRSCFIVRTWLMRLARWWALGLVVALVVACNPTPQVTQTPAPDPQTLLNTAAAAVRNARSVRIKLQLTGAPSYVDPPPTPGGQGNYIAFVSADGAYLAPDRVQAKVVARLFGVPGEVEVIAIGDDQWMRNAVLTGNLWVRRQFAPGFNAAKLVSSDQGIESALKAVRDVEMIGAENVDGTPMYHIKGHAAGSDVAALTVGLIRGVDVLIDAYIVVETGLVDRVVLVQPETVTDQEPKPTTWTLEIFDYDATDIQINPPVMPATAAATSGARQAP
jgi:hypothetical protein